MFVHKHTKGIESEIEGPTFTTRCSYCHALPRFKEFIIHNRLMYFLLKCCVEAIFTNLHVTSEKLSKLPTSLQNTMFCQTQVSRLTHRFHYK